MPDPQNWKAELRTVLRMVLERMAKRGYDYVGRKIYTLAELDWNSTYGFGTEGYGEHHPFQPAGIFMIQGSPCRGVVIIRRSPGYPIYWLADFINDHTRRRFKFTPDQVRAFKSAEKEGRHR